MLGADSGLYAHEAAPTGLREELAEGWGGLGSKTRGGCLHDFTSSVPMKTGLGLILSFKCITNELPKEMQLFVKKILPSLLF